MAKTEISAFGNFTGTNTQGYVIIGGKDGVEGGKKLLSDIVPVVPEQVQADWEQDDDTQKDFIKNKPNIPQIDEETIILDDEDKLSVANPIPYSIGNADKVLTVKSNDGELSWKDPIVYRTGNGLSYSSGGSDMTFYVTVPVPDPTDQSEPASDGDVLTYDSDSDKIVWATPQTFELPTDPLPPSIESSGGELIALTKEWVNTGTEQNPKYCWSDLKWSYVKPK